MSIPTTQSGLGSPLSLVSMCLDVGLRRSRSADITKAAEVRRQSLAYTTKTISFDRALYDATWDGYCELALAGRASEIHESRDRYITLGVDLRNSILEAIEVARREGCEGPELEQLEIEAASLGQKLNRLTARWHTPEDLEDLAAEALAPSREQLAAIRDKLPYPQRLYDEDDRPF